jgi:hypothetical protein
MRVDYGAPGAPQPIRLLAQGRDASATIDSGLSGLTGFQNEGDNEITGWHLSDGDSFIGGIPFKAGWHLFHNRPARQ